MHVHSQVDGLHFSTGSQVFKVGVCEDEASVVSGIDGAGVFHLHGAEKFSEVFSGQTGDFDPMCNPESLIKPPIPLSVDDP